MTATMSLDDTIAETKLAAETLVNNRPHLSALHWLTTLKAREERYAKALRSLIVEIDFVISGGDDEHDRCTECGLAGIGMLRDARAPAVALLKETEPGDG